MNLGPSFEADHSSIRRQSFAGEWPSHNGRPRRPYNTTGREACIHQSREFAHSLEHELRSNSGRIQEAADGPNRRVQRPYASQFHLQPRLLQKTLLQPSLPLPHPSRPFWHQAQATQADSTLIRLFWISINKSQISKPKKSCNFVCQIYCQISLKMGPCPSSDLEPGLKKPASTLLKNNLFNKHDELGPWSSWCTKIWRFASSSSTKRPRSWLTTRCWTTTRQVACQRFQQQRPSTRPIELKRI